MNYQRIIVAGNATRNAEQKTSKKGDVTFTTFSVAVNDGKDNTTFFPVTVFDKLGEAVAKYVTKGKPVLVEGKLSVSDQGRFNIVADQVRFGSQPKQTVEKPEA